MSEIEKKPIKITETILRDAHQSLIATRMTTEQMLPIVETMDKVGYHSVECWAALLLMHLFVSFTKIHGRDFVNSVMASNTPNCRCCSVDRTFWVIVPTQMMW